MDKQNGVNWSNGVNSSDGVNSSYGVNSSNGVNWSYGVNRSAGVNLSAGVNKSFGVNSSYGVINSFGVDHALFLADKVRTYTIFGKSVSKQRFDGVMVELDKRLAGWYPKFNNAFELYLKQGNDWEKVNASEISSTLEKWDEPKKAWEGMPQEAIDYIKSLPEFDAEMFLRITGIDANSDDVKIIVDGETKVISRKSAKALGLIR